MLARLALPDGTASQQDTVHNVDDAVAAGQVARHRCRVAVETDEADLACSQAPKKAFQPFRIFRRNLALQLARRNPKSSDARVM